MAFLHNEYTAGGGGILIMVLIDVDILLESSLTVAH